METTTSRWASNPSIDVEISSEIVEFYNGCNVLLTGGSGYIGGLLIEKLLRTCPGIHKLYLILRSKKNKTAKERYEEFFNDAVYDRLRKEVPNFREKVTMIDGALNNTGLSIPPAERELIKDSNVVVHCAATVRFNDELRFAININVLGTKEIVLLCKEMPNLKAFVYVGTAFSNCTHKVIDEVFYEPPINCDQVLKLCDLLTDKQLEQLTPILVGKWPNTYAFSKSIAEDAVLKFGKGMPVCIVRPSMIIPTEKEPVPGWINNFYGPTGVIATCSTGWLRALTLDADKRCEVIPADYAVNNIIAAAWDTNKIWRAQSEQILGNPSNNMEENPRIYNCVTSAQKPINCGEYRRYNLPFFRSMPTVKIVWFPYMLITKYRWINKINQFVLHIIPGAIMDMIARLVGQKPKVLQNYRNINEFLDRISFFCTHDWQFENKNVVKLWNKMSPIDRKLFYFNVNDLNWSDYFVHEYIGIRTFLLKDPLDTLDAAKKKHRKLELAHYAVIIVLFLLFLWLVYLLL